MDIEMNAILCQLQIYIDVYNSYVPEVTHMHKARKRI